MKWALKHNGLSLGQQQPRIPTSVKNCITSLISNLTPHGQMPFGVRISLISGHRMVLCISIALWIYSPEKSLPGRFRTPWKYPPLLLPFIKPKLIETPICHSLFILIVEASMYPVPGWKPPKI